MTKEAYIKATEVASSFDVVKGWVWIAMFCGNWSFGLTRNKAYESLSKRFGDRARQRESLKGATAYLVPWTERTLSAPTMGGEYSVPTVDNFGMVHYDADALGEVPPEYIRTLRVGQSLRDAVAFELEKGLIKAEDLSLGGPLGDFGLLPPEAKK